MPLVRFHFDALRRLLHTINTYRMFTLYILDTCKTPFVECQQLRRGAAGDVFEHTAPPARCTTLKVANLARAFLCPAVLRG